MPRERARHASVLIQNKLCVIGGRDVADILIRQIDCYDPTTQTWSEVGTLPDDYQTSDFASYAVGNTVYLIGGYNQGYEALSKVTLMDMSDLTNIQFTPGVPITEPRGDITAVAINNDSTIMISGGFTHLNDFAAPLNSVEQFQLGSQNWSPVDALNEERGDKQLIELDGKVYAIGGEGRVDATGFVSDEIFAIAAGQGSIVMDTVEVLDLTVAEDEEVEWKTHGDMPSSLFRFGASGWDADSGTNGGGVIFVFGGQVGFEAECECFRTTEKVLVFDPSLQEAQSIDSSSIAKGSGAGGGNAGAAIHGKFVVGYGVAVAATMLLLFV